MEKTLSILKPDATRRALTGAINSMIENNEFRIVAQKMIHMTSAQAAMFYAEHAERSFFHDLCRYMSSGPVVVQVLEKKDAVLSYRTLMGATDPQKAESHTIRARHGISIDENTVHGSDSVISAQREISFFFSFLDIVAF